MLFIYGYASVLCKIVTFIINKKYLLKLIDSNFKK